MWISDISISDIVNNPTILIAQASKTAINNRPHENVLGVCRTLNSLRSDIYPIGYAAEYMYSFHGIEGFGRGQDVTIKIINAPKYGTIENQMYVENSIDINSVYVFTPNIKSDTRQDFFEIQVEDKGVKVNVRYYINLQEPDESLDESCDKDFWKISYNLNGTPIFRADDSELIGSGGYAALLTSPRRTYPFTVRRMTTILE